MAENEKAAAALPRASRDSEGTATNVEDTTHDTAGGGYGGVRKKSFMDVDASQMSAAFENPLAGISKEQLMRDVETFCGDNNLMEHIDSFRKGALVAQNPRNTASMEELNDEERMILEREHTHRWSQPWTLYWLVIMCSLAAAVQGMDETVNNGAQALYLEQLNVTTRRFPKKTVDNLTGLIVGARMSWLPFRRPPLVAVIQYCMRRLLRSRGDVSEHFGLMNSSSVSLLCNFGVLVDRTHEQSLRTSRHHLHQLLYCSRCFGLGRSRQLLGQPVPCPICAR